MDKYYTILGSEDFIDENGNPRLNEISNKVYAKCVLSRKPKNIVSNSGLAVDRDSYKYYILSSDRQAFNPLDYNSNKVSFVDRVCKNHCNFIPVNQYIFDKYLHFLKSQNPQWIKEINREL